MDYLPHDPLTRRRAVVDEHSRAPGGMVNQQAPWSPSDDPVVDVVTARPHSINGDGNAPRLMELPTKEVLLEAARRAQLLYPGPVGELLHQELVSWLQFGHLLGSTLIFRVANELVRGGGAQSAAAV